jgi:RHS repeat-associated protein
MSSATASSATTSYIYNALGQRIEKTGGPAGTVLYLYDEAGHLAGEYTSTGGLIEETVWLGDAPVATIQPASGGGVTVYYVHADHLNSPRMITRSSDNSIMWRWDTDPFGTAVPNQNPSGLGTFVYNLRFPGQYYDVETGLNYNVARDFDAQTGRYVESDPMGLMGGETNTYAYVGGNPVWYFDLLGLIKQCITKMMLVTSYNDKGPGRDWPYFKPKHKGGPVGSARVGTVAVANTDPKPYEFGCKVRVLDTRGVPLYSGEVHDTGSGWDANHHNVPPDQWIDIWLPGKAATVWGKQWHDVEMCCEKCQ